MGNVASIDCTSSAARLHSMKNGQISFRAMVAADLPAARTLWAATDGVELAEGDSEEELTTYLNRNPGMSFVAIQDDVLVGAILAGHDGRRGLIYHLAVDPRCRGVGAGRHLVRLALDAMRPAKISRVLILVAKENECGRSFWEKGGWEDLTFALPMAFALTGGGSE